MDIEREYRLIWNASFATPFYYIPQYCKTDKAIIKKNHVH